MAETKIITDVAGRVCAMPIAVGASINEGDEVALIEAMKMELPVTAPARGTIKSIAVKIDDVVAEGQTIAVMES